MYLLALLLVAASPGKRRASRRGWAGDQDSLFEQPARGFFQQPANVFHIEKGQRVISRTVTQARTFARKRIVTDLLTPLTFFFMMPFRRWFFPSTQSRFLFHIICHTAHAHRSHHEPDTRHRWRPLWNNARVSDKLTARLLLVNT